MYSQLHNLIGRQITHDNQLCTLIEVIDNGPRLVFQCQTEKRIQCDQHGNANRKCLPTHTIHCLNEQGDALHPVLMELLDEKQQATLLKQLL